MVGLKPVACAELTRVALPRKEQVLAGSQWQSKKDNPGSKKSSSDSDISGSGPDEENAEAKEKTVETGRKTKETSGKTKQRRGRALLRASSSTDVNLFSHPTPPALIKELLHEFAPGWLLLGTGEGGHALRGSLELQKPCVVLSRNTAHTEVLEAETEQWLTSCLLSSSCGAFPQHKSLGEEWNKVAPSSSSSSDSGTDPDTDDEKSKTKKDKVKSKSTKQEKDDKKEQASRTKRKRQDETDSAPKKARKEEDDSQRRLATFFATKSGANA